MNDSTNITKPKVISTFIAEAHGSDNELIARETTPVQDPIFSRINRIANGYAESAKCFSEIYNILDRMASRRIFSDDSNNLK